MQISIITNAFAVHLRRYCCQEYQNRSSCKLFQIDLQNSCKYMLKEKLAYTTLGWIAPIY